LQEPGPISLAHLNLPQGGDATVIAGKLYEIEEIFVCPKGLLHRVNQFARASEIQIWESLHQLEEEGKGLMASTKEQYLRQIRYLARYYPTKPLEHITERQLSDYLMHRRDEQKVRPGTFRQTLVAIRCLYCDLLGKDWRLLHEFEFHPTCRFYQTVGSTLMVASKVPIPFFSDFIFFLPTLDFNLSEFPSVESLTAYFGSEACALPSQAGRWQSATMAKLVLDISIKAPISSYHTPRGRGRPGVVVPSAVPPRDSQE